MCPPVSPCKGASAVKFPCTMRIFLDGNAAARMFGRAHRRRPYGFVWADCVWAIGFVWADCAWTVGDVWMDCAWVVLFVGW